MSTRAFVPACIWLLAVTGAALAEPRKQKLPPWEKFEDDDDIAAFRREVPGSGVAALRGEGLVDAPLLAVAAALVATQPRTLSAGSVSESKIIRRLSDSEYVKWDRVATPFSVADRDFVSRVKLEVKGRDKQVIVSSHAVKDSAAPKSDRVRGELIYGSYVLTSVEGGKKTHVVAERLCDPKGAVATWMVNWAQRRWPHDTIAGLRKQVKVRGLPPADLRALFVRQGLA